MTYESWILEYLIELVLSLGRHVAWMVVIYKIASKIIDMLNKKVWK